MLRLEFRAPFIPTAPDMLRFLRIRRLAVIDSMEVEFQPGFNVLTGETGAGKSILLEAVGLLMGARASGDLVRTGEHTATIEALFDTAGGELVIRREITCQGRSRAFVNDGLATAGALRELAGDLVEIHGQHEYQTLLDPLAHLSLVDAFGGLSSPVEATRSAWERWRLASDDLARLRIGAADRTEKLEICRLQLAELDRTRPTRGEDETMAASRQVLVSAGRLRRLCAEAYDALYERDGAVLAELGTVWRRVSELAAIDGAFRPYVDARDGIKSQLEDLALFLQRYGEAVDASPERLQHVEERLALLERLKKRYGPSMDDVLDRHEALRRQVEELAGGEDRTPALEREEAAARRTFLEQSRALSDARRRAAVSFEHGLEALLADLAMADTKVQVRFDEGLSEETWGPSGVDRAEFYISPNPGENLRPLARIASGGELSRLMLAIRTLTATARHGVTDGHSEASPPPRALIFDEVDAGIGGRAADVVGQTLRALGSTFQVLCITHLPQIAAAADTHFVVEKHVTGGRTRATVSMLSADERVRELSRMLAGREITDTVRASANELLASRRGQAKGEHETKGESESSQPAPRRARRARPGA